VQQAIASRARRYRAAVPVYLVRHAHAGSRAAWDDDDDLRPLSQKGTRQAKDLLARFDDENVGCVVSSPSRRCVETVEPLAKRLGTDIDIRKEFLEGADPDDAIASLLKLAPRNPVVCSHGDLIPKMIRRLVAAGMRTKDANISQKGSLWVIEVDKGRPKKARYYPPG
jgi:phosphohistidine phosphatase SixA